MIASSIQDDGDDKKHPDPATLCSFHLDELQAEFCVSGDGVPLSGDGEDDFGPGGEIPAIECDCSVPVDVTFFGSPRFLSIKFEVKYGNPALDLLGVAPTTASLADDSDPPYVLVNECTVRTTSHNSLSLY